MTRITQNFDDGWKFYRGDIFIPNSVKSCRCGGYTDCMQEEQGAWLDIAFSDKNAVQQEDTEFLPVTLPHDFVIEGSFCPEGGENLKNYAYLPGGVGCYRKRFSIPAEDLGKRLFLVFDGVFRDSKVYVNGQLLCEHKSGYTGFEVDITDVARYGDEGENIVFVRVNATEHEGWWYEGGGIYRHVWLVKKHAIHIPRNGIYITTPSVSGTYSTFEASTVIHSAAFESVVCQWHATVWDAHNQCVWEKRGQLITKPLADGTITISGGLEKSALWSPEAPVLYRMHWQLTVDGEQVDDTDLWFGFRTFAFTADNGMLLNGLPYTIKGTCNHQDFAVFGVALPDGVNEYKIHLLKQMGCNAYRCHHPLTPELLDACDRLGMLVMAENRKLDSSEQGLVDLRELLLRDRSRTCVCMWSLENEETIEGTRTGTRLLQTLYHTVKQYDSTRPVVACMNHGRNDNGYGEVTDLVGYNYGQLENAYLRDHVQYPQRKMICSEATSSTTTREEYTSDAGKGYCSAYETWLPSWTCSHTKSWRDVVENPHLTGLFVWTGFDYLGEPTPFAWPSVSSQFGILDTCGFPKDHYFYYKANWTQEPVLHLFPHWNWAGQEGEIVPVRAYSNADELELFLNGRSLGKRTHDPLGYTEWDVPYAAGELAAKGWRGGQPWVETSRCTAGEPVEIRLIVEPFWKQHSEDIALVRAYACDAQGNIVKTELREVVFCMENGTVLGTSNGDPACHYPHKGSTCAFFHGACLVAVRGNGDGEKWTLTACAEGLLSAQWPKHVQREESL